MHPGLKQIQILKYYLEAKLSSRRFQERNSLELWQEQQIQQLLVKIRADSSFYRQLWQGHLLTNWRTFPIINKEIMMANFDTLNTVGISQHQAFDLAFRSEKSRDFSPTIDDFTIGLSSGTSGHRGLFLVSQTEQQRWAGQVLAKVLPGPLWHKHRIAFFLRANSNLYTTVGSHHIQFQFFDLFGSVDSHLYQLEVFQPTLLVAPPSMLRLLGEAIQSGQLSIQPQKVVSVAEVLEPFERAWLENVYGQPIHQVYQCTEGFLGFSCHFGTLHLNEDLIVIQKVYLDSERNVFTPIITDFSRPTQPIIRYQLNDVLTERQNPCPCGSVFTAIESIDGRCDDLLYFPGTHLTKWIPVFPDFIRRIILQIDEPIEDYQVRQADARTLTIGILGTLSCEAEHQIRKDINHLCSEQHCRTPEIYFQPYEQVPSGTKKRRIQRIFQLPQEVA